MSARTLLVTGAAGQLGRQAIAHLLAHAQGDHIVAGTRNPEKLQDLAAQGVEIRKVDFDHSPAELAQAFAGVDRLLIVSTDALDRPGHRLEQHQRAVQAAQIAKVQHLLYTSMVRPDPANPALLAFDHRGTEKAIQDSGLPFTILRNNWYSENLLDALPYAVAAGALSDATGTGRAAYVSRADCARAAAAALASSESRSSIRDISGPELLNLGDMAKILSTISGKPITAVPVDVGTRTTQLQAAGLPAGFAQVLANSEHAISLGWFAILSDDVRTLTGQAPTPFAELARQKLSAR